MSSLWVLDVCIPRGLPDQFSLDSTLDKDKDVLFYLFVFVAKISLPFRDRQIIDYHMNHIFQLKSECHKVESNPSTLEFYFWP